MRTFLVVSLGFSIAACATDAHETVGPDAAVVRHNDASPYDTSTRTDASHVDVSDAEATPDADDSEILDAGDEPDADIADADDADADADNDASDGGGVGPFAHTIAIDGINDFYPTEEFPTTTVGYTGLITWDQTNVYIGMLGPDVNANSATKWIQVYFGGTSGTTTGITYNTQKSTLPFPAQYHVRWKSDNSYSNAQTWNGTNWVDANWNFNGTIFQSGTYFEMSIPLANIGNPTTSLQVHIVMLNEKANFELTYAGVPSTSFVDSYAPKYTKYYDFDLTAPIVPDNYLAKP